MSSIIFETGGKGPPFFSVVILCWKSNQFISPCLQSMDRQIYKDFEILLIDNGSPIPVERNVIEDYQSLRIKLIRLEENIGFAAGNNFAAQHAAGQYLALLNSDAFPHPNWLKNLRDAIQRYPHCFFASKLIMAEHPEKYDGKGDTYHVSGLAWRKSYNMLIPVVPEAEEEVFSACGAAAIYPREAFEKAKGFDPDYFSYLEDVDLGFRLRLIGYKCIFLPNAIVEHVGSGSTGVRSDLSVYHGHRNLIWTFVKDMPGPLFWCLMPFHILYNLLQTLVYFFKNQGKASFQAKVDALRSTRKFMEKRKQVQSSRIVPITDIMRVLDWNPLSPFIKAWKK